MKKSLAPDGKITRPEIATGFVDRTILIVPSTAIGSSGLPFHHITVLSVLREGLDPTRLGKAIVIGEDEPIAAGLMGTMVAIGSRTTGRSCGVSAPGIMLPQVGAKLGIKCIVTHDYFQREAVGGQNFWIKIGSQAIKALT